MSSEERYTIKYRQGDKVIVEQGIIMRYAKHILLQDNTEILELEIIDHESTK